MPIDFSFQSIQAPGFATASQIDASSGIQKLGAGIAAVGSEVVRRRKVREAAHAKEQALVKNQQALIASQNFDVEWNEKKSQITKEIQDPLQRKDQLVREFQQLQDKYYERTSAYREQFQAMTVNRFAKIPRELLSETMVAEHSFGMNAWRDTAKRFTKNFTEWGTTGTVTEVDRSVLLDPKRDADGGLVFKRGKGLKIYQMDTKGIEEFAAQKRELEAAFNRMKETATPEEIDQLTQDFQDALHFETILGINEQHGELTTLEMLTRDEIALPQIVEHTLDDGSTTFRLIPDVVSHTDKQMLMEKFQQHMAANHNQDIRHQTVRNQQQTENVHVFMGEIARQQLQGLHEGSFDEWEQAIAQTGGSEYYGYNGVAAIRNKTLALKEAFEKSKNTVETDRQDYALAIGLLSNGIELTDEQIAGYTLSNEDFQELHKLNMSGKQRKKSEFERAIARNTKAFLPIFESGELTTTLNDKKLKFYQITMQQGIERQVKGLSPEEQRNPALANEIVINAVGSVVNEIVASSSILANHKQTFISLSKKLGNGVSIEDMQAFVTSSNPGEKDRASFKLALGLLGAFNFVDGRKLQGESAVDIAENPSGPRSGPASRSIPSKPLEFNTVTPERLLGQ